MASYDFEAILSRRTFKSEIVEETISRIISKATRFDIKDLHIRIHPKHWETVTYWAQTALKPVQQNIFITPDSHRLTFERKAPNEQRRSAHLAKAEAAHAKMSPRKRAGLTDVLAGMGNVSE